MDIHNLNIYGGNSQFADYIENKYPDSNWDNSSKEFLRFIHSINIGQAEKELVVSDTAQVQNSNIAPSEKEGAIERIRCFILANKHSFLKWGKIVGRVVIASILAKYGLALADIGL